MATYQVRTNSEGQKILSEPLTGLGSNLATSETPGAVQPDNVTTKVDPAGVLSAIGGNLLLNSEELITESGEWTAPVAGWYSVFSIDGGEGGHVYPANKSATGGHGGRFKTFLMYFLKGQKVSIVIGAGGIGYVGNGPIPDSIYGGRTTIDGIRLPEGYEKYLIGQSSYFNNLSGVWLAGGGIGSYFGADGRWYGAGGGCYCGPNGTPATAYDGAAGAVRFRWHDPAKANGPTE